MPRRLWLLLHEPRVITATMGVAWLLILGIGCAALVAPPMSIAHEIGPTLTVIWGGLLLTGGILGLAGCLPGWHWIERSGILAAGTGTLIYLVVILNLHATTNGSRPVQAGFVALCLVGLAARWLRIRGAQVDPTRGRK